MYTFTLQAILCFWWYIDTANLYSNKKQKQYFMSQRKGPFLKIIPIWSFLPPRVHAPYRGQNIIFDTPTPPVPNINIFHRLIGETSFRPIQNKQYNYTLPCPIFPVLIGTIIDKYQWKELQRLWCILFIAFSPTRFGRYCCHLQGDVNITIIQMYTANHILPCNNITLKMAARAAETCWWECKRTKYITYITVYSVVYLYIMGRLWFYVFRGYIFRQDTVRIVLKSMVGIILQN
jgi:hypothetical protein